MSEINSDRRFFSVVNPATGEEVGKYPLMSAKEVHSAVERAQRKFEEWSYSSFKQRKEILLKASSILAENAFYYAEVISRETGKTRFDALLAEVATVCDVMHYYAKNAEKFLAPVKVEGNIFLPGRKAYYLFEPKGVIGVISPWNYPFTLCAGPVITALSAGNTVVLKPASQTPGSALALQEILLKAGLPEGVFEVVTGSGSVTGEALLEHPALEMLFFTGSTEVGRKVYTKAAQRLKPAIMELGGKDPAIVTKNADIKRAVYSILWGAFTNCGQTCIGMEICLVERDIFDEFLSEFLSITRSLKCGQQVGEIGSMTMAEQLKIVESQVEDALAKGAKVLVGGKRDGAEKGMYYPPTVLTDVTMNMKLMTEETFGPLLPIIPYDDVEEAIRIANSTPYGLSSSVFSKDLEEARAIARKLKTGSVNINDCLVTFAMTSLPFGGVKESGIGRYHGDIGIRAFTNIKSISEFNMDIQKEFYHYPIDPSMEKGLQAMLVAVFSRNPLKKMVSAIRSLPTLKKILKKN